MTPRTIALSLTVILSLSVGGCHKKPAAKDQTVPAQPSAPPPATVSKTSGPATNEASVKAESRQCLLRAQWLIGNRYVYRLEMFQHRGIEMPAAPQPTAEDLNLGLTYALAVEEETSVGGRELELEFLATDLEIKVAGEATVKFKASKEATNTADHPVPAPFRRLIGSKVLIRVGPAGRVDNVLGYQGWLTNVVGDASGPAGQMIAQQFNPDFVRQLADFGTGLLDRPVEPGESWPYKVEIASPDLGKIILDSTVTMTGWEQRGQRRIVNLEASGKLHSESADPQSPQSMRIDHGTVTGKTSWDPAEGTLIESFVEQAIQIKGSLPASTNSPSPGPFTSDVSQKVTVKLLEMGKARLEQ